MRDWQPNVEIDLDKLMSKQKGKVPDLEAVFYRAVDNFLEEMAEIGKEELQRNIKQTNAINTGEMLNWAEVSTWNGDLKIQLTTTSNQGRMYHQFVEFGTGIEGEQNKHPKADEFGWAYPNIYGEKGWVYPSYEEDNNLNKWRGSDGNIWAWTKGREARPFMYNTWYWMSASWHNVFRKHWNRSVREWGDTVNG